MGLNLIDTNILIYFFNKSLSQEKLDLIFADEIAISVVNRIEFLSWSKIPDKVVSNFDEFRNSVNEIQMSEEIIVKTIEIRRDNKTKTPDAIIAATAIINDMTLVSNNDKDFSQIDNLRYYNPMK